MPLIHLAHHVGTWARGSATICTINSRRQSWGPRIKTFILNIGSKRICGNAWKGSKGIAGSNKPQAFLHHPPHPYRGSGQLDIQQYYLHDVLIVAPHLQFPDVPICCACGSGRFLPTQWADRRELHGTDQPISLLQYRYKCDGCSRTMVAFKLLTNVQISFV